MTPIPLSAPQILAAAHDFLDQEAEAQARRVRDHPGLEQQLALSDAYRSLDLSDLEFLKRWAAAISKLFGPEVCVSTSQHQTGRPGDMRIRAIKDRWTEHEIGCEVIFEEPERFACRRLESYLKRPAKS